MQATITTYDRIEAAVQHLGEHDTCPHCHGTEQITCPDHMVATDDDGWCLCCDSPDTAELIICPCQHVTLPA